MLPITAACWLCQMPLRLASHGLCSHCYRQLPLPPPCCPRCGLPALHVDTECGACLVRPPAWQRILFITDWQPPLSGWVKQLKFSRVTALSDMLARLMLLKWLSLRREHNLRRPDLVLCVPLHAKRAWRRGYNQVDAISRRMARWTGSHYAPAGLTRQRQTRVQHRLQAVARRKNLRGAFRVEIPVEGRHIALVDDVVTTGSTANEISRILLAAGAASVQVWSLCRTL